MMLASYVLAVSATAELPVWGGSSSSASDILGTTLLYCYLLNVCRGLKVAQTASALVVSLPILFEYMLMTYSFLSSLKQDYGST